MVKRKKERKRKGVMCDVNTKKWEQRKKQAASEQCRGRGRSRRETIVAILDPSRKQDEDGGESLSVLSYRNLRNSE